jgi:hypothetical protein
MRFRSALFDLDGTLTDSAACVVLATRAAFVECGLAAPEEARVRGFMGVPVERSILDYRTDNRIFAYPSAAAKLGSRLPVLAQAPLVKIDPAKGLPPLSAWPSALQRLPSPSLLHPAGFQVGGFDVNDPDFLPRTRGWGRRPTTTPSSHRPSSRTARDAVPERGLVGCHVADGPWPSPGLTLDDLSVQDDAGRR